LFKEDFVCPWKQAGVWSDERGVIELLKPDYFEKLNDQKVDFCNQFKNHLYSILKKNYYLLMIDGLYLLREFLRKNILHLIITKPATLCMLFTGMMGLLW
jgi:hypothetical protein